MSAAQPGLKIAYARGGVLSQFPDAFEPYRQPLFGCDFSSPSYDGTLFRFPLRGEAAAAASDIKNTPTSPEALLALLSGGFREALPAALLFLKSVSRVSVYRQRAGDASPTLLYEATAAPERGGVSLQAPIVDFIRSATPGGADLPALYRRLASLPADQLPSSCGELRLRVAEGGAASGVLAVDERWLVVNSLAGGAALAVAARAFKRSRARMVPWVGAAARLPAEGAAEGGGVEGKAFCFLPLPIATGLPVHINGSFQLSSNRRDVWSGADMSGAGEERSAWNAALLADALPAAYLQLLAAARGVLGTRFYALFPAGGTGVPKPWADVATQLFASLGQQSLLRVAGGGWAPPSRALLPDARCEAEPALAALLAANGAAELLVSGADVPAAVRAALLAGTPGARQMTPDAARRLLARRAIVLPAGGGAELDPAAAQAAAVAPLLSYAVSDICEGLAAGGAAAAAAAAQLPSLSGLGLLPLADGTLGALDATPGAAPVYLAATAEEAALLAALPGRVIAPGLPPGVAAQLRALAATGRVNVSALTAAALADDLLPRLLPPAWRGRPWVAHDAAAAGAQPSAKWLMALWCWLGPRADALALARWPLLPVTRGSAPALVAPAPLAASAVVQESGDEAVGAALSALGCRLLDETLAPLSPALAALVHPPTAAGVLAALAAARAAGEGGDAEGLGPLPRARLRAFLLQSRWLGAAARVPLEASHLQTLKSLPIFPTCPPPSPDAGGAFSDAPAAAAAAAAVGGHCALDGAPRYLPPPEAAGLALGPRFLQARVCVAAAAVLHRFRRCRSRRSR